ncbi:MAG: hypothetical protein AAF827_13565 [Cyanobacteria bacterium P01_D01_bin.6]
MTLIICPGIHNVALSDRFLTALNQQLADRGNVLLVTPEQILPTQRYAPFNGFAVWSFLQEAAAPQEPLLLIGFSAGVVGAVVAAQLWQAQRRGVAVLIAVDGWGVPKVNDFPLHRVSHDYFTHWSSAVLGAGEASFYADPSVTHLDLWQFPERAQGWRVQPPKHGAPITTAMSAIAFITELVVHYSPQPPEPQQLDVRDASPVD